MANNCFYTMVAVAKSREILERLLKIMQYKDEEYFIYRCFSADMVRLVQDGFDENGKELWRMMVEGDVAWSCTDWFNCEENMDYKSENGAHYVTLDILCKKLGFGLELYSEECGCEFQEHYWVTHDGEVVESDCVDWTQTWEDEDGNDLDEPIETGGFDDYCDFAYSAEIYGEDGETEE